MHRSSTPLHVAAAAITRATESSTPSRITVIRLLGDALFTIQESQLAVDAAKARVAAHTGKTDSKPLTRFQLESDARTRAAHEQGCRAIFSAVVSALLKLPTRAGPLRRRAVELLAIAGKATGPAVAVQAVDRARAHIGSLKKLSWTETDVGDFEVVCAIMTLADVASCQLAGREVARETIQFMLSQRVRQKCKRSDLSYAIAAVLQSFPTHAAPDDRLLDAVLEFCLSSPAIKQGTGGFGSALLTAVAVPMLVSRGSQPADDAVASCAKALRVSPTPTERGMWAIALVRASVTGRRSATYQLQKYGTSDATSKFPSAQSNTALKHSKDATDRDPSVWVSDDIFGGSLLQIAQMTGLREATTDSSIAIASLLRMWSQALPLSIPDIIPKLLAKLLPEFVSVGAVSALVDAIWLGLLKHLKPSLASSVFERVASLFDTSGLHQAAALHICGNIVAAHGRQALRESGFTTQYSPATSSIIHRTLELLESPSIAVRFASVRLMSHLIDSLPRTCSQFLTTVLQSIRIADLSLATKGSMTTVVHSSWNQLESVNTELSSILGNGAALSMLIEKITTGRHSVPAALERQCAIDSIALLRLHQAANVADAVHPVVRSIRRRIGWGLLAALARGKVSKVFEGRSLDELLLLWKSELGSIEEDSSSFRTGPALDPGFLPSVDELLGVGFEEFSARSSARSASLYALYCVLQDFSSFRVREIASTLIGATSGRIVSTLSLISPSSGSGPAGSSTRLLSFASESVAVGDSGTARKRNALQLLKQLTVESYNVLRCMGTSTVSLEGESRELCFYLSLALGAEAQRVLGETNAAHALSHGQAHGTAPNDKTVLFESALSNQRLSLFRITSHATSRPAFAKTSQPVLEGGNAILETKQTLRTSKFELRREETAWLFGRHGIDSPSAEDALVHASSGVAVVLSDDISASGHLIETFSVATLSPLFSATIALELAKRLSRSDFSKINRALAVLQILSRRSLSITGGSHRSVTSQNKIGRLFTPNSCGSGTCVLPEEIPGFRLVEVAKAGLWSRRETPFSNHEHIARFPFQNFHSRALGMMYATRIVAAEAHREFSIRGGTAVWIGLTRRVLSIVKDNQSPSSASQTVVLCNAITTLGALLEVVPEPQSRLGCDAPARSQGGDSGDSIALEEISDEAIDIISNAIEAGNSDVQASAALALSACSHRVAASSERLLGTILRAWSQEKGEFPSLGHFGRFPFEAEIWRSCFSNIWCEMGVKSADNSRRFYSPEPHGAGSVSPLFASGAAAILSSCRLHWWPISESCFLSAKELAVELLQWGGHRADIARAAGLHSMTALWSAKIDVVQAGRNATTFSYQNASFSTNRLSRLEFDDLSDEGIIPVEEFSLKDASRLNSPVGPFLDEILYQALAPYDIAGHPSQLQRVGVAALREIIRGLGVRKTCENLPRLPESLFAVVDEDIVEGQKLLQNLVQIDAPGRPRYWFGLCRAICLNGERLHFGQHRSMWDVSTRTKAYACELASEVLGLSIASCECFSRSQDNRLKPTLHTCAFGFLRKIFDFIRISLDEKKSDIDVCDGGCNLLQRLAISVSEWDSKQAGDDMTLFEFKEMWDPCVPILQGLLQDRFPHFVVDAAAAAISEEAIVSLHSKSVGLSSINVAQTFLNRFVDLSFRGGFRYSDMGEDVGLQVTLALLSKCGKLMSALHSVSLNRNCVFTAEESMGAVKMLLFAACGDFISTLMSGGLSFLSSRGGALPTCLVSEQNLQNSFSKHISSIIFGAVSCSDLQFSAEVARREVAWENEHAPGARMASGDKKRELSIMAMMVWLFKHERGESSSNIRLLSFRALSHEALQSLFRRKATLSVFTREAVLSLAQWNLSEFFCCAEGILEAERISVESAQFLLNIILSILLSVTKYEISGLQEVEKQDMAKAFRALKMILLNLEQEGSLQIAACSESVLDSLFRLICAESKSVVATLVYPDVKASLIALLVECLKQTTGSRSMVELCLQKCGRILMYGLSRNSDNHIDVGVQALVSLRETPAIVVDDEVVRLLVACPSSCRKDNNALALSLKQEAVENFICSLLRESGNPADESSADLATLLLLELGKLSVSMEDVWLPAVFRSSVAAILVNRDGGSAMNKIGMILYTVVVSRFVYQIDRCRGVGNVKKEDEIRHSEQLLQMVDEEAALESFVASMTLAERIKFRSSLT